MHREPLLRLLAEYAGRYPQESETTARLERFVRTHADCFERTSLVGHLTGSAWLLDRTGTRALLTHHRKIERWMQLGGHADGEADLLAVALREAREESGIDAIEAAQSTIFDIDIHEIAARGAEPRHYHYDCRFLLRVRGDDAFTVSDESHELRWVQRDEVEHLTREESVLRMLRKWDDEIGK